MKKPDSSEVAIVADQDPALRLVPRLLPDALALVASVVIFWQALRTGDLDERSMSWVTSVLAGELFTTEAARRGLAGIVIDGACRDTPKLATLQLPLYARWVCPAAGTAERLGATQQPVVCGGVSVRPPLPAVRTRGACPCSDRLYWM